MPRPFELGAGLQPTLFGQFRLTDKLITSRNQTSWILIQNFRSASNFTDYHVEPHFRAPSGRAIMLGKRKSS